MGTCCLCPPPCFLQTGTCSHRGPACAQQHRSGGTSTTMPGVQKPPHWVLHLRTPLLPGSAGPRGSPTGGAEDPGMSLPCCRHHRAHQFPGTHSGCCSGTYGGEFPAGITAVPRVSADGDVPGWGAPARGIPFPSSWGWESPGLIPVSPRTQLPAQQDTLARVRVRNPKVLDLSPKPRLHLLWTQCGPSRGGLSPAMSTAQRHCV